MNTVERLLDATTEIYVRHHHQRPRLAVAP